MNKKFNSLGVSWYYNYTEKDHLLDIGDISTYRYLSDIFQLYQLAISNGGCDIYQVLGSSILADLINKILQFFSGVWLFVYNFWLFYICKVRKQHKLTIYPYLTYGSFHSVT